MTHDSKTLTRLLEEATPGPWGVSYGFDVSGLSGKRATYVAPRDPAQVGIKLSSPWREGAWDGDPEADANANLCALAPDLAREVLTLRKRVEELEAATLSDEGLVGRLEKALQRCEGPDAYENAIVNGNDLRAAIAVLSMGSSR